MQYLRATQLKSYVKRFFKHNIRNVPTYSLFNCFFGKKYEMIPSRRIVMISKMTAKTY